MVATSDRAPPGVFDRFRIFETPYTGLPAVVDLHWDVESPGYFGIPFHASWQRRRRLNGEGLNLWTLSLSETLLIAALHGTRENWRSMRHILDFARVATTIDSDDWLLAGRLSQSGSRRSVAVALGVVEMCGVHELPARPGVWARQIAEQYLAPVSLALQLGQEPGSVVGRSPLDALRRRHHRFRVAPTLGVAFSGLLRSSLCQAGLGPRSWNFRND